MRFAPLAALTALVAPLALVSCAEPQPLYVDQAWIRPNPNGQGPAAGYLVIHGGEAAVRLLRVTSDAAMRIEMHQSVTQDGMTTMEKIDSLDVPAKEKVTFEPGGKHLMIFNINPGRQAHDDAAVLKRRPADRRCADPRCGRRRGRDDVHGQYGKRHFRRPCPVIREQGSLRRAGR